VKILVLGAAGQIGYELCRAAWPEGTRLACLDYAELDITSRVAVAATVAREKPDLLVNAAAYTAVDRAESDGEAAFAVNRDGPAALAASCRKASIPLIHISTDYVFDGAKTTPYTEDDPVNPLGIYGQSKDAGDRAVREALCEHVILRTAWVYGVHGHNFAKTMLRLAGDHPRLRVVADQVGSPTAAADIAAAIVAVATQIAAGGGRWGTFHFVNAGAVSWHGFAEAIFALAAPWRGPAPEVAAIATADYPTPAERPANSVLDCGKIAAAYRIVPRPWREALADVIGELFATAPPNDH
jgi:dTDP-4-dehydrorhamnose reductase